MLKLSKRLCAVAGLGSVGNCMADVGTEHGDMPIYLIRQGVVKSAIAMDINEGPLSRAKENIRQYGLDRYIAVRHSDGVLALQQKEADSVVIAGMGGGLVIKILTEGREILSSVGELILQPQSEVERVRHFLYEEGYRIVAEDMVFEDGKFYPMMRVLHGAEQEVFPEIYFQYGKDLLVKNHTVLANYLKREEQTFLSIKKQLMNETKDERIRLRIEEIEKKLALVEEAKTEMMKHAV